MSRSLQQGVPRYTQAYVHANIHRTRPLRLPLVRQAQQVRHGERPRQRPNRRLLVRECAFFA